MNQYRRRTRIPAPLDEVWTFHSRIDGLVQLTPGFLNLRIERVVGSDGEPDPDHLESGSRIFMSIQPFGVGPRQSWISHIREREKSPGSAYFVDEMSDGPFKSWRHTHRFYRDGTETILVDEVEYELPFGGVGTILGPIAVIGFEPMFRYRHRRTRERFRE